MKKNCDPGIFETMRFNKGRIIGLDEHLDRLIESAARLKIRFGYSKARLKKAIKQAMRSLSARDIKIRVVALPCKNKTFVEVSAEPYIAYPKEKYSNGFRLWVSPALKDEAVLLARIKSTERSLYESALSAAKNKKADEAIIINKRNYVCECSRSNIFWIKANVLFTPSLECGCLPGITRSKVMGMAGKLGLRVRQGKFTLSDLVSCDEAFLTNSLMGIMPVEKCGPKTRLLIKKYACLLK